MRAGSSQAERRPRSSRPPPNAQIIVFSGFARANVVEEVFALGAVAYLEKGASPDMIVAAIEEAFANTAGSPTSLVTRP